jgi:prophage antirepressor-like protein
MTAIIPFTFEAAQIRVIDRDGAPWFVLADVCTILEVGNASDVARRLDDDEKGVDNIDTLGGVQNVTTINESGLWSVVLTSRKENAKRFKKWLTSEVIPSIRKTGGYGNAVTALTPLEYALALVDAEKRVIAEQAAHAITGTKLIEAKQVIATKEGVDDWVYANELAKQINQALGKAIIDLKRFPTWIEKSDEFINPGFANDQPKSEYHLWFRVIPPQKYSHQNPGERLCKTRFVRITPIGQTKLTNMVLRDKNRNLPIYRSAYQGVCLRIVKAVS